MRCTGFLLTVSSGGRSASAGGFSEFRTASANAWCWASRTIGVEVASGSAFFSSTLAVELVAPEAPSAFGAPSGSAFLPQPLRATLPASSPAVNPRRHRLRSVHRDMVEGLLAKDAGPAHLRALRFEAADDSLEWRPGQARLGGYSPC